MGAAKKASKKPPKLIAPGKAKAALAGGTIGIVTHVGDTLHHNDKKHNKHASAKKHRGDAYRLLDDDTSKRMRKQLAAVGCKLVRVVDFMELKRDDFEPFMEDEEKFDHYCKRMREDGTWGGNQELYAAARHFRVYVVIHMESARMVIECDTHKPQKVLHVAYHGSDHYDSVRSIQDVDLDEPPREIVLDCDGFRPEDLAKRWNGKSAEEAPLIAALSPEDPSSVDALAQGLDALHVNAKIPLSKKELRKLKKSAKKTK
uniref:OTU domain-containing protein n=1 Tax=Globisporangium ultimum (strain ATCC 200006 / CBS 805.95 / DAOM BR144) TaxID=431595 RepID=K3WW04_GLOUD